MAPGATSKFGAPMFEPDVFWKQMDCIEKSTCDIVGTFRRPGNCAPFAPPRYAPLRNIVTVLATRNLHYE